jgi:hypothetical protein
VHAARFLCLEKRADRGDATGLVSGDDFPHLKDVGTGTDSNDATLSRKGLGMGNEARCRAVSRGLGMAGSRPGSYLETTFRT